MCVQLRQSIKALDREKGKPVVARIYSKLYMLEGRETDCLFLSPIESKLVQLFDAVDTQAEIRRTAEGRFVENTIFNSFTDIAHPISVGINSQVRSNGFTAYREVSGIKDV